MLGAVRGIPLPHRDEDFSADASELFFDLVFVFAFSRLVYHLVHVPTWEGIGEFALVFTLIWLPWTQFTWSANAVAGNSRPVRALFLVATIASLPMAAGVTTAFDDGGPAFAISASVILAMGLLTMIVGLGDEPGVRASVVRYSIPNWIAIASMIGGSFLDREPRIALWLAAVAIILVGTIRAGSDEWIVRPGHFAERHALIVIVALGEVIVALGAPIATRFEEGTNLDGNTVVALAGAGLFAGLVWWSFFDRPSKALEHRHEQLDDGHARGRFARDVYTYLHFPLVAGIILATAGLEEVTLHPTDRLPTHFRWMLVVGLALFLVSVVGAVYRAFRRLAVERLIAAAVLVVVAGLALAEADGLVVLFVVDALLLAMLVVEHRRVEGAR
jgi:low temperature requirement protein LtrA